MSICKTFMASKTQSDKVCESLEISNSIFNDEFDTSQDN